MTQIAATIWIPKSGEGEFTTGSSVDIADASGKLLVDASSNNVIDSGTIFNGVPGTTWSQSDGS